MAKYRSGAAQSDQDVLIFRIGQKVCSSKHRHKTLGNICKQGQQSQFSAHKTGDIGRTDIFTAFRADIDAAPF